MTTRNRKGPLLLPGREGRAGGEDASAPVVLPAAVGVAAPAVAVTVGLAVPLGVAVAWPLWLPDPPEFPLPVPGIGGFVSGKFVSAGP